MADGGNRGERVRRYCEPIAHPCAVNDHVVSAADRDAARDERDHRALAMASASGARLSSQTATASASAAWSGVGGAASPRSRATMRATWSFSARPFPHTALL